MLILLIQFLASPYSNGQSIDGASIYQLNWALTQTMIPDGVNPPLASRFYVYPNLLFYRVLVDDDLSNNQYFEQIRQFPELKIDKHDIPVEVLGVAVYSNLVKQMVYRPALFDSLSSPLKSHLEEKYPTADFNEAEKISLSITKEALEWIESDNYNKVRAMPDYTPNEQLSSWVPTAPNYYDALEPNWPSMNALLNLDLSDLILSVPVEFDTTRGSDFYNSVMHVYSTVKEATDSQYLTAKYWDCNPLQTHVDGHHMINSQQMTPGGHWIGIAGIASQKAGLSLKEASRVYSDIALGLYEGFRLAWTTKYKADLIRPETYINKYIDQEWRPLIETPPFPEYTSAHSVISMTSAVLLEQHFGESFELKDTMETHFGLEVREYNGFIEAAEEVSISRVYGGIHYQFAVDDGMKQGRLLAQRMQAILPTPVKE